MSTMTLFGAWLQVAVKKVHLEMVALFLFTKTFIENYIKVVVKNNKNPG